MKPNRIPLVQAIACIGALALAGCGGGGGGGASPPPVTPTAVVSMSVSPALGKFKNGVANPVSVKIYRNGAEYKTGVWDDSAGKASFTGLAGTDTSLIVQVEGGEYFDESDGSTRSFSGKKLRTVIEKPYAEVAVTPVTHAAAKRLIDDSGLIPKIKTGKSATDIVSENLKEGQRFGLGNPLYPPVLVDGSKKVESTDAVEAQKYALILAAMAEAAKTAVANPAEMADDFAKDLADGKLDGAENGVAIPGLKFDLSKIRDDIVNTLIAAAGNVQAPGYTTLASLGPSLVDDEVTDTEVQTQVNAVVAAGDALGQARTLFSTLRAGIFPYANSGGTGYTQTQLDALRTNLNSLQSSAIGAADQLDAIQRATQLAGKLLGNGKATDDAEALEWGARFSSPNMTCFTDMISVNQNGYAPLVVTYAAGCRMTARFNVTATTYDRMVFLVTTDKVSLNQTATSLNDSATFAWRGRIDRYDANTDVRLIRGVNTTTGLLDATARQLGTITATVAFSETDNGNSGTWNGTIGPVVANGNLWPVLVGTDTATVDMKVTATLSGNWQDSGGSGTFTSTDNSNASLKLEGTLEAKNGSVVKARLTFAPSAGTGGTMASGSGSGSFSSGAAGSTETDNISNGAFDAKVTFTTEEFEIAGAVLVSGLSNNFSESQTFQPCCTFTSTESTGVQTMTFSGSVKTRGVTPVTVFEGSFNASNLADSSGPTRPTGTATLVGTLKRSSTDGGLRLTVVIGRSSQSAPATFSLSYTDSASNLNVQATWTEGGTSGRLSNNLSAGVEVTLLRTGGSDQWRVKKSDGTLLGSIVGGFVTYIDGYTESIL